MKNKLSLYIDTIRYMNARQIAYRFFYIVRKGIGYHPINVDAIGTIQRIPLYFQNDVFLNKTKEAESVIDEADEILHNHFKTVANNIVCFDNSIDWDLIGNSYRLRCFRINSFRFLVTLSDAYKLTGSAEYINHGFDLIDDWIEQCGSHIKGDKWNPYVIAERLCNWIGFVSQYCDDEKIISYARYINQNAIQLRKTVEYQIDGNHLLSEGKALVFAGAFLQKDNIYNCGKKILLKEFNRQFLPDGGHYERSVSYHVESMQQYFETIIVMKLMHDKEWKLIHKKLIAPYRFLNSMIGVDGHIPLFNDAACDYPFDARDFLGTSDILYCCKSNNAKEGNYSKRWKNTVSFEPTNIMWTNCSFFSNTGILHKAYRIGTQSFSLFFDCGEDGAKSIPAHIHADALSVLWSDSDGGILVDSGVWTYESCEERNACRSTAAHNTIEIDEKNSAEVWSAFRVGKRGSTVVEGYKDDDEIMEISAKNDGYSKTIGDHLTHTRKIYIEKKSGKISINDIIEGDGKHKGVLRFHLSPQRTVEKSDYNTAIIDDKYLIKCSKEMYIEEAKTAYCFGSLEVSKCIAIMFNISKKESIISNIEMIEREETK